MAAAAARPGEQRVCNECGEKKDLNIENFVFRKSNGIFRRKCRECYEKQQEGWNNEYYAANPEKCAEATKKFHLDNPGYKQEYNQQYYQENRKTLLDDANQYYQKHREERLEYGAAHKKERYRADIIFRMHEIVSGGIRAGLKRNGSSKKGESCFDKLPYTEQELITHIERLFSHPDNLTPDGKVWMTWENQGKYEPKTWDDNKPRTWFWQLDHIIPRSELPYTNMSDPNCQKCWALENLRPLSAKINHSDGVKRTRHKKSSS